MITARTKLFAILCLAGMAGVLSVLLIDLSAFLANIPATAGLEMPFHPLLVKLLSVVQTAILLSIAIFIGVRLAPLVGLSAPAAEALARGNSFISALKPQVLPGLIAGFTAGVVLLSSYLLFRPILPLVFVTRAERIGDCPDLYAWHRNLRENIDHKYGRRSNCFRGGIVANTVSAEAEPKEFSA